MAATTTKYNEKGTYPCPNPLVSPAEKATKAYGLAYAKYIHSDYLRNGSQFMFFNNRLRSRTLWLYYQGQQSTDQYKQFMQVGKNKNSSWINLDWTVRNYATKRGNVASNMLNNEKYDAILNAIDPLALNEKKEMRSRIKSFMENKEFLDSLGIANKLSPIPIENLPQNNEQLEVAMSMDYKQEYCMKMELAIALCLDANDYDQIKKENALDKVVVGISSFRCELDSNGFPKIVYVDPDKLIVPYSIHEDFKDINRVGHIEQMTISDLRQKAGNKFTKDEYEDIAENYCAKNVDGDYNSQSNPYVDRKDSSKLNVMHFCFLTDNEDVYESKKDKRGNPKMWDADYARGTGKNFEDKVNSEGVAYRTNGVSDIYRDKYKVVYEGYWIVGSDYIFNYGLKTNMERAKSNLSDTRLPYHIFAPNMKNGRVVSLMEQMRPKLDDIQNVVLKIQHTMASAIPKGVSINLAALRNTNFTGAGGKRYTEEELIQLFFQRGIVVYEETDYAGMPGANKPITELENGMANDIVHLMNLLQMELVALDEIVGLNQITAASTPHQDTLKGVADLSVAATNNAFHHLFHAQRSMYKGLVNSLSILMQDSIKNGSAQLMAEALGQSSINFMEDNAEVGLHEYGIKIEIKPSDAAWQAFYAEIKDAVSKGLITMADRLFIQRVNNMKEAEQVFIVREQKRAAEAAKAKQIDVENNMKANKASTQAAMDKDIALIEAETNGKIAVLAAEKENIKLEYSLKKELLIEEIKLQGIVKSQHLSQEGEIKDAHIRTKGQEDHMNTVLKNEGQEKKQKAAA